MDESAAPLVAVIAYDDISAGRRAMSMLGRTLREEADAVNILHRLWRLDLILHPRWREEALNDALAADLLILSTSEPVHVPSLIETWISAFLSRQRRTATAILARFSAVDEWSISLQQSLGQQEELPLQGEAASAAAHSEAECAVAAS
jgi:hypothetical protein